MRRLVVSAWVAAMTTGPALACPRQMLCMVTPNQPGAEVAVRTTPRAVPDVRTARLPADVGLTFDLPARPAPVEIEMPWIWRVLREQVYAQMPSFERRESFTLMLAPVVVVSPSDTIPGVGVAGSF